MRLRHAAAAIGLGVGGGAALGWLTPGTALLCGIALALTMGNPWPARTSHGARLLLQVAVAGLGAGMDLAHIAATGARGIGYTSVGIAGTMGVGLWLARRLRVARETGMLLSVGTAICGGSAIAAVGAAIRASAPQLSVALAMVFALNAVGLWIFPLIGTWLAMDASTFGLWSALAIHDTSAVVGAALAHSAAALQIAAPVKLARALWIVPLTLAIHRYWAQTPRAREERRRAAPPWFILGFVCISALVTWVPAVQPAGTLVAVGARRLLVATLFFIGATLSREALIRVGWRPVVHGILLWILVATTSLLAIQFGWIHA